MFGRLLFSVFVFLALELDVGLRLFDLWGGTSRVVISLLLLKPGDES